MTFHLGKNAGHLHELPQWCGEEAPKVTLEWPVLFVLLDCTVIKFSSNQPLCIKYCVVWIHSNLILCSITYQPFCVCECNIAWCCAITLQEKRFSLKNKNLIQIPEGIQ